MVQKEILERKGFLAECMLQKIHLVHTTPNYHPPKMDFLPKYFLQIILAAKMACVTFKYVPQKASTTFAFSSVCFFFYG